MWGWHWGVGGWLGMSLMMVIFWTLVIWAIVWLVRTVSRPTDTPRGRGPEDILRDRSFVDDRRME